MINKSPYHHLGTDSPDQKKISLEISPNIINFLWCMNKGHIKWYNPLDPLYNKTRLGWFEMKKTGCAMGWLTVKSTDCHRLITIKSTVSVTILPVAENEIIFFFKVLFIMDRKLFWKMYHQMQKGERWVPELICRALCGGDWKQSSSEQKKHHRQASVTQWRHTAVGQWKLGEPRYNIEVRVREAPVQLQAPWAVFYYCFLFHFVFVVVASAFMNSHTGS